MLIGKILARLVGRRRAQGLRALMRDSSIFTQEARVCDPGPGKIVVLAPHMDDEVIGCGGTIARHAQAGAQVTVIFLTDGRYGGGSYALMSSSERRRKLEEHIGIRKQEAQRAAAILGVQSLMFLDAEDTRLCEDGRAPMALREILQRIEPQCVYLPYFLDRHRDHRAANSVLLAAVAGTGLQFECCGYEVWTPLFPNRLVKVDATIELKQRALSCYQSQLTDSDYVHAAIGLNAHRSLALGGRSGRYAEAFHALPVADYLHLYRSVPTSMLA